MSTIVESLGKLVERLGAIYYRVRVVPTLQLEYLSPSIADLTGYPVDDFYRDPCSLLALIHPDNRMALRAYLAGEDSTPPVMLRCICRDERVAWIEHRAAAIRNDAGDVVTFEGVCFDVTEQVQEEEAHREQVQILVKDRASRLSQLIHHISHDLRHPVISLQMYARILRGALDDNDSDSVLASLQAIDDAAKQLEAMIQSLTDSARLETGQLPVVIQPIPLGQFVGKLARRYAGTVVPHVIRTPRLDDVIVEADPLHLERVLNNLVSNAVKYSGTEEILLGVEARDGEAILSVADRGIGIAAEDLPHLFERGYRSREATHLADGLGLGLYISHLLVDALGGRLWVESTPGQGSTFFIALPALHG